MPHPVLNPRRTARIALEGNVVLTMDVSTRIDRGTRNERFLQMHCQVTASARSGIVVELSSFEELVSWQYLHKALLYRLFTVLYLLIQVPNRY